jgi:hypothetical protein
VRKTSLALVSAVALFGQVSTQPAPTQWPDYTLFRFFFLHVAALERAADSLKAQGKDDEYMRAMLRSSAHLTDQEATLVKSVAASCNQSYTTSTQQAMAALSATRAAHLAAPGTPASPAEVQQANALEQQRQQVILNCVATLQTQMLSFRFQTLHDYVVANIGPTIKRASSAASAGPLVPLPTGPNH